MKNYHAEKQACWKHTKSVLRFMFKAFRFIIIGLSKVSYFLIIGLCEICCRLRKHYETKKSRRIKDTVVGIWPKYDPSYANERSRRIEVPRSASTKTIRVCYSGELPPSSAKESSPARPSLNERACRIASKCSGHFKRLVSRRIAVYEACMCPGYDPSSANERSRYNDQLPPNSTNERNEHLPPNSTNERNEQLPPSSANERPCVVYDPILDEICIMRIPELMLKHAQPYVPAAAELLRDAARTFVRERLHKRSRHCKPLQAASASNKWPPFKDDEYDDERVMKAAQVLDHKRWFARLNELSRGSKKLIRAAQTILRNPRQLGSSAKLPTSSAKGRSPGSSPPPPTSDKGCSTSPSRSQFLKQLLYRIPNTWSVHFK